ncbi:tripartite tricarboxylate transporter substrate binding protein [Treponema sp. HNW]|uniref:tripartite tricarboxylate transporter substrate binding protein n=1 Tax=Treponema sp. HNW TaxID=3116654 RepID=UPI003D0C3C90
MKKIISVLIVIIAGIVLLATCTPKGTEGKEPQYPTKALNIVVPYAPGGASDTVARIYAKELQTLIGGKPVTVTNLTGASGAKGLEFVKNSPADGYTLAYMPVESTMIKALGFTDVSNADFKFVCRVMTIPAAVTVSASAPYNTLQEFIEYAKKNPSKIKVGNSGTGSIWHVAAASLEQKAGIKLNHVPFDGAAPAVTALLGGNIDAVTVSPSEVKTHVDSGKFKVLAILSDKHSSVVPDVKTAKEQGFDVIAQGWGGFAVPKNTPAEIIEYLDGISEKAVNSESVKKLLKDRGFEFAYLHGKDMDTVAQKELNNYGTLIPKLNIIQK